MVGLYVGDDEVIGLRSVHGIEHGNFFVYADVRVVGNAVGNGILSFEEVNIEVVDPDVSNIFGHVKHIVI